MTRFKMSMTNTTTNREKDSSSSRFHPDEKYPTQDPSFHTWDRSSMDCRRITSPTTTSKVVLGWKRSVNTVSALTRVAGKARPDTGKYTNRRTAANTPVSGLYTTMSRDSHRVEGDTHVAPVKLEPPSCDVYGRRTPRSPAAIARLAVTFVPSRSHVSRK